MKSEEYQKGAADMLANIQALQALAKEVGAGVVWNKTPAVAKVPVVVQAPQPQIAAVVKPQEVQSRPYANEATFPIVWNEEPTILKRYAHWCASVRPGTHINTYYALCALGVDRTPTRGDVTRMTHLLQRDGKFEFVGVRQTREKVNGVSGSYRVLRRTEK